MKFNIPIALASLLLSVMLWLVVYAQNVPEPDTLTAPLTADGLDDGHYFVRSAPTDVRLLVSGPADRIKEMRDETITAYVDLSSPREGKYDYPITVSPAWVSRYLIKARPTARVEIERMGEREVPITRLVKGSLRDANLKLVEQRFSPRTVIVRGPESEVAAVTEVRAYFDLTKINPLDPQTQESDTIPMDRRGNRPAHIRTTPSVVVNYFKIVVPAVTKPAQVVPDLDVTYSSDVLPDGYRLDPKTVALSGTPAVLANVSKIPTEIVRARDLSRTQTFRARLLPPKGTKLVGPNTIEVTLLVRPGPTPRSSAPRSSARSADAPSAGGTRTPRPPSPER